MGALVGVVVGVDTGVLLTTRVIDLAVKLTAVGSHALCAVTRTRWPTVRELKLTLVAPRLWKVVCELAVIVMVLAPLASVTTRVEFCALMEEMTPVAQARLRVECGVAVRDVGVGVTLPALALVSGCLRRRKVVKPSAPSRMIPMIEKSRRMRLLIHIERFS